MKLGPNLTQPGDLVKPTMPTGRLENNCEPLNSSAMQTDNYEYQWTNISLFMAMGRIFFVDTIGDVDWSKITKFLVIQNHRKV